MPFFHIFSQLKIRVCFEFEIFFSTLQKSLKHYFSHRINGLAKRVVNFTVLLIVKFICFQKIFFRKSLFKRGEGVVLNYRASLRVEVIR